MKTIKVDPKKAIELNSKLYLPFDVVYISEEESFCVCIGGKVVDIVDFIDGTAKELYVTMILNLYQNIL